MPQPSGPVTMVVELELLARLLCAVVLGGFLGLERELGGHSAGLRTHILVTLGSAAFTIAGTFGVAGLGSNQDPGRVAAQIVTGVGFLGAGTIWRSSEPGGRGAIYGLTTAATIWVAAAVGMLCGFGLYLLGAGTALLGLLVLRLVRPLERFPFGPGGGEGSRTGKPVPAPPRRLRRPRPIPRPAAATAAPARPAPDPVPAPRAPDRHRP